MMRVLALVQQAVGRSPGQRFRLEQWAPHLENRHGIKLEFLPFESPELTEIIHQRGRRAAKARWMLRDAWRRREALVRARECDAVVVYREASMLGPAIYERWLAAAGVPMIFDFDDAIWLPPGPTLNGVFARLHFSGKTSTICKLSRAVVTGNEYLADWARRHSRSVFVVPTSIELAKYSIQPPLPSSAPFTIVWTGTVSTLVHLETARPAIEQLGGRLPVRLRVVCSQPPARPFAGVENEFVRWKAETEAADLAPAHVGIMPLPDTAWTRGKCGCKALQYMAIGRPVVASPVGVNADIVRSGQNGILASTEVEWLAAFEALAASSSLRDSLGEAGRRTVEQGFSAEASAARFAEVVHHAVGRSSVAPTPAVTTPPVSAEASAS